MLVALVVALATAFAVLKFVVPNGLQVGREEISEASIGASFRQVGELSVEEYAYSNVGNYDNKGLELAGVKVPLTGRNFLLSYSGTVKAGIADVEAIGVNIDDAAQTITVRVPEVSVTSSEIDDTSVQVYKQSMNPLNQVKVEDVTGFLAEEKTRAADRAVKEGLLDRAHTRVEELMTSHAEALKQGTVMQDYEVHVEWVRK